MPTALKFHKVTTLPGTLEADAFYFVENGTYAESYLTNSAAVARSIGNSAMINALITQALSAYNTLEIVADITARNALNTKNYNFTVLVVDATGDATVASGAALYAFRNSDNAFIKVAEYESMDATISWTAISGRPSSTPGAIDAAVAASHTHSNKTQLDKVGENGAGDATYNGVAIQKFTTNNW